MTRRIPARVVRAGQTATRGFGRWTAGARMTPAFLICGGQRCGTTSMQRALRQHPAVLPAVHHKGVHYFDIGYHHPWSWYMGHFPLRAHGDLVARRIGTPVITGESSPYYLYHPLAPERIARDLPDARIITLVRDPVERAYSGHAHELSRGYETEPFERALALEEERTAGETERLVADPAYRSFHHQHHSYLARGRYVEHLDRLARALGRHRILVLQSEQWFAEPEAVFGRVLEFLGLPNRHSVRFARHNAEPRAAMPERLRRGLRDYFEPYDEKLVGWLDDVPGWRR
jgi:hypothetical protein